MLLYGGGGRLPRGYEYKLFFLIFWWHIMAVDKLYFIARELYHAYQLGIGYRIRYSMRAMNRHDAPLSPLRLLIHGSNVHFIFTSVSPYTEKIKQMKYRDDIVKRGRGRRSFFSLGRGCFNLEEKLMESASILTLRIIYVLELR